MASMLRRSARFKNKPTGTANPDTNGRWMGADIGRLSIYELQLRLRQCNVSVGQMPADKATLIRLLSSEFRNHTFDAYNALTETCAVNLPPRLLVYCAEWLTLADIGCAASTCKVWRALLSLDLQRAPTPGFGAVSELDDAQFARTVRGGHLLTCVARCFRIKRVRFYDIYPTRTLCRLLWQSANTTLTDLDLFVSNEEAVFDLLCQCPLLRCITVRGCAFTGPVRYAKPKENNPLWPALTTLSCNVGCQLPSAIHMPALTDLTVDCRHLSRRRPGQLITTLDTFPQLHTLALTRVDIGACADHLVRSSIVGAIEALHRLHTLKVHGNVCLRGLCLPNLHSLELEPHRFENEDQVRQLFEQTSLPELRTLTISFNGYSLPIAPSLPVLRELAHFYARNLCHLTVRVLRENRYLPADTLGCMIGCLPAVKHVCIEIADLSAWLCNHPARASVVQQLQATRPELRLVNYVDRAY